MVGTFVVSEKQEKGRIGTGNREQGTGNRAQGTGNREQGTGNREQGTGNREQGTGNRSGGVDSPSAWERSDEVPERAQLQVRSVRNEKDDDGWERAISIVNRYRKKKGTRFRESPSWRSNRLRCLLRKNRYVVQIDVVGGISSFEEDRHVRRATVGRNH